MMLLLITADTINTVASLSFLILVYNGIEIGHPVFAVLFADLG
jgi:hypothetical protein